MLSGVYAPDPGKELFFLQFSNLHMCCVTIINGGFRSCMYVCMYVCMYIRLKQLTYCNIDNRDNKRKSKW